jgi:hypothetical protein
MPKKYKILLCLSIPAVFLIFYSINDRETKLTSKMKHSHVLKAKKSKVPVNLADNDNMVAAILIIPKSYLPALEQFSNSVMAKNITILRAQLESKDGQMTAVYKKNKKRRGRKITPANNATRKINDTILEKTPEREKRILTTGFLYLLASIHRRLRLPNIEKTL